MELGTGAWATSHINPSLVIKFLGASVEEEDNLKNKYIPDGEILGSWNDICSGVERTLHIYNSQNNTKLRYVYQDGSFSDADLVKDNSKYIYENKFGEYLLIESNGNLGWYADDGKFCEASKLTND